MNAERADAVRWPYLLCQSLFGGSVRRAHGGRRGNGV
jgi:hypothetical protein